MSEIKTFKNRTFPKYYIYIFDHTYLGRESITVAHMALRFQSGLELHIKHSQSSFSTSNSDRLTFLFIHP